MLAIEDAIAGRIVAAAWWALYGTLTDRLDGAAAKMLKAQSEFGVQFDSLADLAIFGVVPPAVFFAFYARHPELGWATAAGARRAGGAVRGVDAGDGGAPGALQRRLGARAGRSLPRHAVDDDGGHRRRRVSDGAQVRRPSWTAPGDAPIRGASSAARASTRRCRGCRSRSSSAPSACSRRLRVPKLGRTRSRALTVVLAVTVAFGYGAGLFHRLPEYMLAGGLVYLVACVVFHLRTR